MKKALVIIAGLIFITTSVHASQTTYRNGHKVLIQSYGANPRTGCMAGDIQVAWPKRNQIICEKSTILDATTTPVEMIQRGTSFVPVSQVFPTTTPVVVPAPIQPSLQSQIDALQVQINLLIKQIAEIQSKR